MTWNFRLFKKPKATNKGGDVYFIGEAYYDEQGNFDGGYSENYDGMLSGLTAEDVKETYDMIGEAFTQPVIELTEDSEDESTSSR